MPTALHNEQPSPIPSAVYIVLGVIFCDAFNQILIFPFVPFLVRCALGATP
jgi:hypothetical protein